MAAQVAHEWTCPHCGEVVPIEVHTEPETTPGGAHVLRVTVPEVALADAFAHVWTHHEEGDDD